jgi:DNA replication and repair protein RecF
LNKNIINQFKVENFRNIQPALINFSEKINVIIGNNGNGKTNLLEAIHYLFRGKSFRKKNTFPQMLSSDCVKSEIIFNASFQKDKKDQYLSGVQNYKNGNFFLNNKKSPRCKLPMVFISPHDAFLFFNDSSFRKDKVHFLFSSLSKDYKESLSLYTKTLKQKNSLLKGTIKADLKLLEIYNQDLARLTCFLTKKKQEIISTVNPYLKNVFGKIFSESFNLKIQLKTNFNQLTENEIFKIFNKNTQKELILKTTINGQHKDDYVFYLDDFLAQEYASLGQLKMSYFSVLFAFIEVFYCKINESPIVLIDDVSGELDHIRLKQLLAFLGSINSQVFLTSANTELFLNNKEVKILKVSDGMFL